MIVGTALGRLGKTPMKGAFGDASTNTDADNSLIDFLNKLPGGSTIAAAGQMIIDTVKVDAQIGARAGALEAMKPYLIGAFAVAGVGVVLAYTALDRIKNRR